MTDEIIIHETRYDRQNAIDGWDQTLLQKSSVFVAGVGALGNEIVKNLALIGVGTIILVDRDKIEKSNLSRSVLFRETDVGQYKAQVAAKRLQILNPDVQVIPIVGDLNWDIGLGLFRRVSLIMGGLDNIEARLSINNICMRLQRPWIDAALDESNGVVRIYHHDDACFECGISDEQYRTMAQRYSCQHIPLDVNSDSVPTVITSASLMAGIQVQEALKWLHGNVTDHSFTLQYTADTFALNKRLLSRRDTCFAHDPLPLEAIIAMPHTSIKMTVRAWLEAIAEALGTNEYTIELDREVVYRHTCATCGNEDNSVIAKHRISQFTNDCPNCGSNREIYSTHKIKYTDSSFDHLSVADIGLPPLHIVRVRNRDQKQVQYIELTGDLDEDYQFLNTVE